MKWLVRIGAGVIIALLMTTLVDDQPTGGRVAGLAILGVLVAVGAYEGIDTSSWFGDDDDDPPGPTRPA